ncbi:MAG: hypothetical protein U9N46_02720 [Euryarchaeota archaeon]|nr:hypothetical protein [Euryarchaeota archaeon]
MEDVIQVNQKKNITTMVLTTLAVFIFVLFMHTFVSPINNGSSIIPSAAGVTTGFIIAYTLFGSRFDRLFWRIALIFGGLPIAGLFVGVARYLHVEVTLPMFSLFLAIGICISLIFFRPLVEKTDQRKLEMAYATDERGEMLNYRSATVGFIALSVFLLTYLIEGYLKAGIFDRGLLLTLCGSWIVLLVVRSYYEWRM